MSSSDDNTEPTLHHPGYALLLGLLVICLVLLSSSVARSSSDYTPGDFRHAMVYPGESGQTSRKFRDRDPGTSAYEFTFMLYCLSALSTNRAEDAIRDCSEAIALNPKNAAAYKLRALAYYSKHKPDRALRDFDRASALDPNDPEAQGGRGAVFRDRGDTRQALGSYSRAIALEPGTSRWWNARCWTRAIVHTELQAALADCDKAIALDASFVQAYDSRGLVYLQMRDFRRALADYNRALHLRPSLVTALYGRGVAKIRLADRSGESDIERARDLDPAIDSSFRRYGIVVDVPSHSHPHIAPNVCGPEGCEPPPSRAKPAPGNDTEPARAASLDLGYSTKGLTP
jgi:regulator of sirC expression with transglutaminase-like and TPR domain